MKLRAYCGGAAVALLSVLPGLALFCAQLKPVGVPLDLNPSFAPVVCGNEVRLFSAKGLNQVMMVGDTAPRCNPVPLSPALQPVCYDNKVWFLGTGGAAWVISADVPVKLESGLTGALAILPAEPLPYVLFPGYLRLPGGKSVQLPFKAASIERLSDGSLWIWGKKEAVRTDGGGRILWRWNPGDFAPGPAVLSGAVLFAGTGSGDLVALKAGNGKRRFLFRGGGAITSPPIVDGKEVVYASADHFIRALDKRGNLLWQTRTEGRPSFGPYRVKAGFLFAESAGTRLFILGPKTGQVGWRWKAPSGTILKAPAVEGNNAFVLVWGDSRNPTLYRVKLPSSLPKKASGKRKKK